MHNSNTQNTDGSIWTVVRELWHVAGGGEDGRDVRDVKDIAEGEVYTLNVPKRQVCLCSELGV
jgi:hypothetical protein